MDKKLRSHFLKMKTKAIKVGWNEKIRIGRNETVSLCLTMQENTIWFHFTYTCIWKPSMKR